MTSTAFSDAIDELLCRGTTAIAESSACRRRCRETRRRRRPAARICGGSDVRREFDFGRLDGMQVLVVDDHDDTREVLTFALEAAGALVLNARAAVAGMALLGRRAPALVVTDINMPEHDGVWLLHAVRARWATVPVIAMSGLYDAVSAREAGFDGFLTKPVNPDTFCEKARTAIAVGRAAVRCDGGMTGNTAFD